ncbi:MAG TPA: ATP-binding protein [Gemmataceae bacterium]|jgi:DNA polymerase III delta prime subunit
MTALLRPRDCAQEQTALQSPFADLAPALEWLDGLLQRAVASAEIAYGPAAAADAFRGLHLQRADIEQLLSRAPGATPFDAGSDSPAGQWPESNCEAAWVCRLRDEFGLTTFDLQLLMIALAPELDLRYERIYAFLQDDVSRKRPTVDLALNLLSSTPQAKLERRAHFLRDAPLLRYGLIHLVADPGQIAPPLLAQILKPDEDVLRIVLSHEDLDSRLATFCAFAEKSSELEPPSLSPERNRALEGLAVESRRQREALVLYFLGPPGAGQRSAALALAARTGLRLLVVNLERGLASPIDFQHAVPLLLRTARHRDAILYFEGFDTLSGEQHSLSLACLLDALREFGGISILAGAQAWPAYPHGPRGVVRIPFAVPQFNERRACWNALLEEAGIHCQADEIDSLAGRYRLPAGQIADAVAVARQQVHGRVAAETRPLAGERPTFTDLCASARAQASAHVTGLARKIEARATWKDLVLPSDSLRQLRELCNQAKFRQVVYDDWGFERKLSLGKGLVALFSGTPGTGKTLATEIIAQELALELYKIDLSQVVSKYIGETEKNLDRVFNTAERANAILLFDEADALFGQRSQVRDAHDRYANIEVGYLLQKMEEYDGVAILATNLAGNMDSAFVRRLTFRVEFPFPDEAHRERIWRQMFTEAAPCGSDVDFPYLARQFKLAGGSIKNVVLAAAFSAAAERQAIGMPHLLAAVYREFQKMGKLCTSEDFGQYGELFRRGR